MQGLINVQAKLKAPKGQFNAFGKYKFRSCEDILEAVKPHLAENGLQLTLSDKPLMVGDWHYIEATASVTDGKETVTVTAYAREALAKKGMDESQITGTASSYARKYALNGLFCIDDTKDADATNTHEDTPQTNSKASKKPANKKAAASTQPSKDNAADPLKSWRARIAQLEAEAIQAGMTQQQIEDAAIQAYGTADVSQLDKDKLQSFGQWLKQSIDYYKEQQ